jgi:hypothetical protein
MRGLNRRTARATAVSSASRRVPGSSMETPALSSKTTRVDIAQSAKRTLSQSTTCLAGAGLSASDTTLVSSRITAAILQSIRAGRAGSARRMARASSKSAPGREIATNHDPNGLLSSGDKTSSRARRSSVSRRSASKLFPLRSARRRRSSFVSSDILRISMSAMIVVGLQCLDDIMISFGVPLVHSCPTDLEPAMFIQADPSVYAFEST